MIRVRGLTYRYPQTGEAALKQIDLDVQQAELVALVGANGAGKSTLCYALSGFVPHFFHGQIEGSVEVAGINVVQSSLAELAGQVGLVFQDPFNQITGARFSVREEIAFGLENLGVPRQAMIDRIGSVLELLGMQELAERSPYAMSGGQQQRLAIASVLVMEPRVLILDEPTSQLDPAGKREVFSALDALTAERKTTVIVAEHNLEWVAQFADRVIALESGRLIAAGEPRQVLGDPALVERGLGQTRYTQAAQLCRQRGLCPEQGALPVTLEQTIQFLQ